MNVNREHCVGSAVLLETSGSEQDIVWRLRRRKGVSSRVTHTSTSVICLGSLEMRREPLFSLKTMAAVGTEQCVTEDRLRGPSA